MLTIDQYVRAESLEQAYELCQKRNHVVLGGMLWLKMQDRKVGTAIDLCGLGLDRITETERAFELGAMVPLRALETHEGLNAMTRGAFARSVEHIVGVQFRNCATVGGSVFGRFGFSDVLTLLLALDARVVLQGAGELSLEEFCARPPFRDIWSGSSFPRERRGRSICPSGTAPQTFPSSPAPSPAGRARSASPSGPGRGGPGSIWMRRGCCLAGSPGTAPWPWGRICPAGSPWGTTCVPGRSTGQRSARPWCAGAC